MNVEVCNCPNKSTEEEVSLSSSTCWLHRRINSSITPESSGCNKLSRTSGLVPEKISQIHSNDKNGWNTASWRLKFCCFQADFTSAMFLSLFPFLSFHSDFMIFSQHSFFISFGLLFSLSFFYYFSSCHYFLLKSDCGYGSVQVSVSMELSTCLPGFAVEFKPVGRKQLRKFTYSN